MNSRLPLIASALLSLLYLLPSLACTDSGLQAIDNVKVNVVDNLLQVTGSVCTDPPQQTDFPVKILFIIDGSGSMSFTDPNAKRALATEEVILRLHDNPSVSFAVLRFNQSDDVLTKPNSQITSMNVDSVDLTNAFTRDMGILMAAVQGLRIDDSVTDYQGALSVAYTILAQDMINSSAAQRSRTKYVLIFMSDGDPFPYCCASGLPTCNPAMNIPFCSDPPTYQMMDPTLLPYVKKGVDYNQPYQIFAAVRDIMNLAAMFGVGELRLHTGLLFDPSLVTGVDAQGRFIIAGIDIVDLPKATMLLKGMAQIGMGVFKDFSKGDQIDFLGFDLTNIKRENSLKNFILTNTNIVLTPKGLKVDSDGDGLTDDDEFAMSLNRLNRDTDGDMFNDKLEFDQRRLGMDPLVKNPGCENLEDQTDADGDGLLKCEELLIRSNPTLFDSDADGVPDWLETVFGTDPVHADALNDSDLDTIRNGDEIREHTNVAWDESSQRTSFAYRYKTSALGLNVNEQNCYQFEIKNVQLATPLARPGEANSYGRNDILVYFGQAPADDPFDFGSYKVACINARYVAPDFKDPPSGQVKLTTDDFKDPTLLDMTTDCVGLTPASGM
jgi:hypothetical protein